MYEYKDSFKWEDGLAITTRPRVLWRADSREGNTRACVRLQYQ